MTLVAESTDTSCSAERPPKSTAMRSRFVEAMEIPVNDLVLKCPVAGSTAGVSRY